VGVRKHILLYGPPGAGKSTVGRLLAASLGMPFVDLDDEIEAAAGSPIPEIMAKRGEAGFRELEFSTLGLVTDGPAKVIALGGGALLLSPARKRAEACGVIVLLEAELKTLLQRLRAGETTRPLMATDPPRQLAGLLKGREDHYKSLALRVATDVLTPSAVAREIQVRLGRFHVRGMGPGYDVLVEPGASQGLGELLLDRGLGGPVVIVSDAAVAPLYGDLILSRLRAAGLGAHSITVPAGEAHKTLDTVRGLWESFVELGLDRKSAILALGGGVVGDQAGFAAATYMRGVPWIAVPTSLLAMLDAAIGGKTAFDLPQGKNLIGAFHAPRLVLVDPSFLATLPVAELRSGLAEAVKCGVIADPRLFHLMSSGPDRVKRSLQEVICRAIAVKVEVVESDPYETGLRAALNFGHTVGHALETASSFTIRHGDAVSIGMVAEARLAERLGIARPDLCNRIAAVLARLDLPVELQDGMSAGEVLRAMRMDKKRASGEIRFALPSDIGKMEVGVVAGDLGLLFAASDPVQSVAPAVTPREGA
jgi:3-dehydroquinate synthase